MRFLSLDAVRFVSIAEQDSPSGRSGLVKDSSNSVAPRADSANAAVTAQPVIAQPVMRTPENGGYLKIAYGAAAVIYISYLLLLRRRWTSVRARQEKNTLRSGR